MGRRYRMFQNVEDFTHIKLQQCVDLSLQSRHGLQKLVRSHSPHHTLSSEHAEKRTRFKVKEMQNSYITLGHFCSTQLL